MNAEANLEVESQELSANHTAHSRLSLEGDQSRHLMVPSLMLQREGPQRKKEERECLGITMEISSVFSLYK